MFGFSPSTFSDPFDVNKVAGTNSREQAKLKSQAFLTDSQLGGAATGILAQNKAEDIMAKAGAAAQRSQQNAQTFGNIANFAGSMGTIGASKGGFSGFFDQWKGWGNSGGGNSFAGVPNSVLDSVLKQP
tara:strand:+ start:63 stop:449 length:387 start_codon:yes stop_codon:yes gene_type:complete